MKIERMICGAYAENAYCIDGELLIDPGDNLAALTGFAPNLKAILLTHGHFDHMLAAEELQRQTGVPVYVHPQDAPMLTDASLSAYDAGVATLPQPTHIAYTEYPEQLFGFRVLHTPGHTPGSCACITRAKGCSSAEIPCSGQGSGVPIWREAACISCFPLCGGFWPCPGR